jgi:hypothetical protein
LGFRVFCPVFATLWEWVGPRLAGHLPFVKTRKRFHVSVPRSVEIEPFRYSGLAVVLSLCGVIAGICSWATPTGRNSTTVVGPPTRPTLIVPVGAQLSPLPQNHQPVMVLQSGTTAREMSPMSTPRSFPSALVRSAN